MFPHRHRHHVTQEENTDSWLMSYADMITLLMCFFIIFVSVSEPKRDKFSEITEGLANKFGSVDMATPFSGVFSSLQAVIEGHQVFRDVAIDRTDKSVEMEIAGGVFFKRNNVEFDDAKRAILLEMADTLKQIDYLDYVVTVEAHTSDRATENAIYKTNWDLSAGRAAAMTRFLIETGIPPNRIRAIGYGDTQPKVPNADMNGEPIPENRDRNERVTIKIERAM
jgi:chemotaxis protein MotB